MSSLPEHDARDAVLQALLQIEEGRDARDALHRQLRNGWDKRDKAFITDLVYGVTRWRRVLDALIDQASNTPVSRQGKVVRNTLRMAFYQIRYQRSVPVRAAVHSAVELVKRRQHAGAARFANAVLRQHLRLHPEPGPVDPPFPDGIPKEAMLARKYSHPDWLVQRWSNHFGYEATEQLLIWNNLPAEITLRVNLLRLTPEKACEELTKLGWQVRRGRWLPEALRLPHGFSFDALPQHLQACFQVQDESSMLAVHALDPQPGWRVLDMAAAPGGKATHIAEKLSGHGQVYANDRSEQRLRLVRENFQRLGVLGQAVLIQQDARRLAAWWRANDLPPVDAVLLDAPCSGTGVLRRRVEARWSKTPEGLRQTVQLQQQLLEQAGQLVRPGGVLLYSTCSIEPEENQLQIEHFLKTHPEFRRGSLADRLPHELLQSGRWAEREGELQLFPPVHGTDGFYLCRLIRTN